MFSTNRSITPKRSWLRSPSSVYPLSGLFAPRSSVSTPSYFSGKGQVKKLAYSRFHAAGSQREDDDAESTTYELHLAVCIAMGRIGAAYYDAGRGQINVLEDIVESYVSCDILKSLIAQVQPTNVIASAKQDEKIMHHLKTLCVALASDVATDPELATPMTMNMHKPRLTLLRAWDFGYTTSKRRICTVVGQNSHMESDGCRQTEEAIETESRLRAAFAVNFDASCMVRAFGALLKFLNLKRLGKTHALASLTNDNEPGDSASNGDERLTIEGINCVRKFTLEKTLMIDVPSFEALQIFQQQYHPSVYKAGRTGMKEGLSLFNICNHCRSGPGALELRRWFLRPLTDLDGLKKRLDAVQYFADDNNDEITAAMGRTLQNIRHLASILNRMRLGKISVRDWNGLYKTLYHCCRLGELLIIKEKRPALLSEFAECFGESLYETRMILSKIIDFEASRRENRFVVQRNVDEELDARKDFLHRLPEFMTLVANEEMLMLDLSAEEANIVYYPLLGYLLKLPQPPACGSETGSLLERDGLELRFVANGMAYYKSEATRRMDTEFGDVQFKIIDRETSIMLNLQQAILEHASDLLDAIQAAAQVDCLISLATAARTFNWTKPNLVDRNIITVDGGRHPLQEIVSANEQFVPNPIQSNGIAERNSQRQQSTQEPEGTTKSQRLINDVVFPKVHLLTGPNASGKSVYLKQVGLIVYLAHVGSFVPAKKAEIGVFDGIFTRLRTLDSITCGMSSFAIDLRQMSVALRHATGKSLVLIDEFGKGTSPDTGTGLFAASLEYWLERTNDGCPHVFACSHLYGVLDLLPDSPLLEYKTMNVLQRGDQLVFLYKLISGTIEYSLAAHTARTAKLPITLIERAMEIYNNIKAGVQTQRPDMTDGEYQMQCMRMSRLVKRVMAVNLDNLERPLQEILQEYVVEFENDDMNEETAYIDI